ncbi:MAG: hypothetical protein OEQ29_06835 [Alphaproteobacteria bacterium]|nr:hypothetical protein [Alphaproteobacteria bacterium]
MARKPNYSFEKRERERAKAAKKAARAAAKAEKAEARKGDPEGMEAGEDDASPTERSPGE